MKIAFLPGSAASTGQTVSQVPQLTQASVTMFGRRRRATSKSPGRPLTDSTVVRRQTFRFGWSMTWLRWKHLRTPACWSLVGRHWPQSLVGKTVPMRAARPPRKGRRSTSSTRWRAGHAATDDEHLVAAVAVSELVGHGGRVGDGRLDEADRLVGDRRDVVVVDPAAALADVGDLEVQAAGAQLLEAARREVGRAAGEDELAPVAGLHQLEQARPALAAAPVAAAQHLGVLARGGLEAVEVDVVHRAGALAEEDERGLRAGGHDAAFALAVGVPTAPVWLSAPAGTSGGRASIASTGQLRAQLPQPMQRASS